MERIKRIKALYFIVLITATAMAQENNRLTLEDLIPGGQSYHQFIPERLYNLQWKGEQVAWYDMEREAIVCKSPQSPKEEEPFLSLQQVNEALAAEALARMATLDKASFLSEEELLLTTPGYYAVWKSGSIARKLVIAQTNRANNDYCPTANRLAYTVGNNLWIATEEGEVAVTNEPEGITCGGGNVHRNEFGITKGTFWSPNGNHLAFYRMDERMVTEYPLVSISSKPAKEKAIRYPMAGMPIHKVTVGVYNLSTAQTTYLDAGDPTDRYFTNIAWSPDESKLYIIELNRDQNHAQLVRYDAHSGKREAVLIEDTHPAYVEPQYPITFVKGNDKQFIYQCQRDGYSHLYLYNTDGTLIRQLTSGEWVVKELLGFDKSGSHLFILSTEESPLEAQLYKVNLKSGKRTRLTKEEGVHNVRLSPSRRYAIDTYSSAKVPGVTATIDAGNGKELQRLLTAANPYEGYDMPCIESGTIKAADEQTDLHYRMVKPQGFDPSRKYPAIVYVYGGPHQQMVKNSFNHGVRGWDIYMAGKGYVVFTLDNRGSMNRGLAFENVIFRQLGIEEVKDQMKGVEFLKSLSFIDGDRLGVHGWSYGGHLTTALLLHHPGVFKVGVAGGPVINWEYYEAMYGERYMDTPQSNPEGYQAANLNNLAGNLKDRLLIIHDDEDSTCVLQHTLSFMKACIEADTYPDLFIYPGHPHNVRGHDRVHLHKKITRYFDDYMNK